MLDAVWSGARGWLTTPVLFVFINIVIGTIAVMSKLMSSSAGNDGGGDQRRSLMRAPSVAFDRLRCFSFSRLGMSPDHHTAAAYAQQYPAFDDGAAAAEAAPSVYPAPDAGEWRPVSFLRRAPSVALDRLRGLSFSRRGALPADDHAPATPPSDSAAALCQAPAAVERMEREREHEHQAGIERSQSEAAAEAPARRRARGKKTRMARTEERSADGQGTAAREAAVAGRRDMLLPPAVEVDARADDFIRQFREELRLQRLDSILRYKDTLRRTGTV